MMPNSRPRSLADVQLGKITATVWIDADPERVFRALASDEVTKWWGSDSSYRTSQWVGDVRPGGAWRAAGAAADETTFSVSGEFLEVDPPRKLVLTWNQDWDETPTTIVTYLLQSHAGGTNLTVQHDGFGPHRTSCESHASGWEMVLGWLQDYVAARPQRVPAS